MTDHLRIFDTTLRDGMQQEGMSVSVDEKVRIALKLDELGVHFIGRGSQQSSAHAYGRASGGPQRQAE